VAGFLFKKKRHGFLSFWYLPVSDKYYMVDDENNLKYRLKDEIQI